MLYLFSNDIEILIIQLDAALFLLSPAEAKMNRQQGHNCQNHAIEVVAHYSQRRNPRKGGAQQNLGAVRKHALNDAGENIQNRRYPLRRDVVFCRHRPTQRRCHNNSNGVIFHSNIKRRNHGCHGILRALAGFDIATHLVDNPLYTAQFLDDANHTAEEQRKKADLKHIGHACSNGLCHFNKGKTAGPKSDHRRYNNAGNQQDKYIEAQQSTRQDEDIWDNLNQAVLIRFL
ncbi:MAG: hypothetical protein V8R75_14480 [Oscillospiraceae bacterium]